MLSEFTNFHVIGQNHKMVKKTPKCGKKKLTNKIILWTSFESSYLFKGEWELGYVKRMSQTENRDV